MTYYKGLGFSLLLFLISLYGYFFYLKPEYYVNKNYLKTECHLQAINYSRYDYALDKLPLLGPAYTNNKKLNKTVSNKSIKTIERYDACQADQPCYLLLSLLYHIQSKTWYSFAKNNAQRPLHFANEQAAINYAKTWRAKHDYECWYDPNYPANVTLVRHYSATALIITLLPLGLLLLFGLRLFLVFINNK